MNNYRILIVEDEIIIADTIERYLTKIGHQVVGIAISYEEAIAIHKKESPDLVLLDIRINSTKSGIDVARYLRQQRQITPFIFLTSQLDSISLDDAKATFPAAYLTKPIQKSSLYTTIEVAMFNHRSKKEINNNIHLFDGEKNSRFSANDILYMEAHHIYVNIYLSDGSKVTQRQSLKEMLDRLNEKQFVQTHRSFAVNVRKVEHWDNEKIYMQDRVVPVSRTRRKILNDILKKGMILTM